MKNWIAVGIVMLTSGAALWGLTDDKNARRSESPGEATVSEDGLDKKKENLAMGQFVIVCYRPKPGKEAALLELVRNHMSVLRGQKMVTDRPAYAMRAGDGTIVEVFEWRSAKAVEEAHTNAAVQEMWKKFGEACDYEAVGNLAEAKQLFSSFTPIDLAK